MSLLENLIATAAATSKISEKDLMFVFSQGVRKIYPAGEYLFQEGTPCLWVGIIEDGLVELIRDKGVASGLISVLARGATIVETAMTGGVVHDVSAYTRKGATVWQVPIEALQSIFQIHADIYYRLIARFAMKQRYAADQLRQTQKTLWTNYDQIMQEGWLSKEILDYILKP
jgi:CRP-like cAMP-binding protein